MAQYTDGTVTLVSNSATVVGASTDFLTASAVKVGNLFKKSQENAFYNISAVNTATNINITPAYAGANASAADYLIVRDFTPNYELPEITGGDLDWNDAYTRAMRIIDTHLYANIGTRGATYAITSGSGRFGWAVGFAATANTVKIANASAGADQVAAIGVIASDAGTSVDVYFNSIVASYASKFPSTPNTRHYLKPWSTTATYNLTATPPTTASYIVQYIGANQNATALLVNIQEDYVEL